MDAVRQNAQVLGDEGDALEPGGQHPQKVHTGALLPGTHPGGLGPRRDGPIALQSPEVVDADDVEQFGGPFHPANPPAKAVLLHGGPVVQGVAPELAVLGKVVRRHPRHLGGTPLPVQKELRPLAPHVGGVQGNVDGQIADEPQAQAVDIGLQGRPLGEKPVLDAGLEGHFLRQLHPPAVHGLPLVAAEALVRPVKPGQAAEMPLHRPVQRVLPHPGILLREGPGGLRRLAADPGKGLAQQGLPALFQSAVVDFIPRRDPGGGELLLRQEAVLRQKVQVDEQRISGEGGFAGVGGVPAPGGTHGQNLPPGLPGVLKKVGKGPGLRPQGTDAIFRRQGKNRQEYACGTLHKIKPPMLIVCLSIVKKRPPVVKGTGGRSSEIKSKRFLVTVQGFSDVPLEEKLRGPGKAVAQ